MFRSTSKVGYNAIALVVATLFFIGVGRPQSSVGQDGFALPGGQSFSAQNFGATIPSFGAASSRLSVKARVAVSKNQTSDPIWLNDSGDAPVAYLVVTTTVADGWHIYSAEQGTGGKPTKFVDTTLSNEALTLGAARATSEIVVAEDALGSRLEELFGAVDWILPIYGAAEGESLESLTISGTVDALACSEGEGGACVPQNVDFTARYDADYDVDPLLAKAAELAPAQTPVANAADQASENVAQPEEQGETTQADEGAAVSNFASNNFFVLILIAFCGGFILNFTPCVLPVVGLKILSFFEQAGRSRGSAFLLNVWYAVGVLIVFGALAFASVGLSFLFTRSLFQIIMGGIVFAMALSLIGVWELETPSFLGGEKSSELTSREGAVGAIFKGVITTLLAIPCGAPLLSPALDWASETTRQGQIGLVVIVYLVIGLGMAFPFLVAGAFPELLKIFPKPGNWTETFRKTMGYFLLIAVLWIVYSAPLEVQLSMVAFFFALWFACWNIGRLQYEFDAGKRKVVAWCVSLVVLIVTALFVFSFDANPIKTTLQSAAEAKLTRWAVRAERDGKLSQEHWSLFDRATLDATLASGRPVAVDFTADWCMNCKFLEKTILHTDEVQAAFDAKNVLTLTADWTNLDAETPDVVAINELLDACGARQVPTLMIFNPNAPDAPVVLRGLYTKSALLEALDSLPDAK